MHIYFLHNGDNKPRYIGLTSQDPNTRLYQHKHTSRQGSKRAVYDWMRKYGEDNIFLTILETLEDDNMDLLNEREQYHIAEARAKGLNILNHTDGGGGAKGHKHTEEFKEACAKRMTGRPSTAVWSEESRERVRQAQLRLVAEGKHQRSFQKHTEETKKKLSEKARGNSNARGAVRSDENRRAMSERAKGNSYAKGAVRSEEHKRKLSEERKGKPSFAMHKRWHLDRPEGPTPSETCGFCIEAA